MNKVNASKISQLTQNMGDVKITIVELVVESTYMREKVRPLKLDECGRRQRSECDAREDEERDSGYEVERCQGSNKSSMVES